MNSDTIRAALAQVDNRIASAMSTLKSNRRNHAISVLGGGDIGGAIQSILSGSSDQDALAKLEYLRDGLADIELAS